MLYRQSWPPPGARAAPNRNNLSCPVGNFYTNVTVRGAAQPAIIEVLRELGRRAIVTPAVNGFTTVCDKESESQDQHIVGSVALTLSARLQCPAWAILNHDDDVLWYQLYDRGQLADEYISSARWWNAESGPPPRGSAESLCHVMIAPGDPKRVQRILRRSSSIFGYLFAINRHSDLVKALGMPLYSVGSGHKYLSRGDLPEGLTAEDLARI